jgi:hypothetical protein
MLRGRIHCRFAHPRLGDRDFPILRLSTEATPGRNSYDRESMPKAKEFTVTIEDKPGALGKCFLALAERGVNILALQSFVEEGESLARLLVDDPAAAMAVLGGLRMIFEQTEVAVIRLAHRPGELGRAAARLGEHKINIDYSYCGLEPGSTQVLVVFGVDNLSKAAKLLDDLAAE